MRSYSCAGNKIRAVSKQNVMESRTRVPGGQMTFFTIGEYLKKARTSAGGFYMSGAHWEREKPKSCPCKCGEVASNPQSRNDSVRISSFHKKNSKFQEKTRTNRNCACRYCPLQFSMFGYPHSNISVYKGSKKNLNFLLDRLMHIVRQPIYSTPKRTQRYMSIWHSSQERFWAVIHRLRIYISSLNGT
jgi:hypothetical protein|uniref:Uncharacterized protein n=1 Tax=Zea mays TaxID=4577 RepID=A0A804MEV1_MAIZE